MSFREEFTLFQDIIRVIELRVLIVAEQKGLGRKARDSMDVELTRHREIHYTGRVVPVEDYRGATWVASQSRCIAPQKC